MTDVNEAVQFLSESLEDLLGILEGLDPGLVETVKEIREAKRGKDAILTANGLLGTPTAPESTPETPVVSDECSGD